MGADLEDGVAPSDKEQARAAVVAALKGSTPGPTERLVRINAWPSALAKADLAVIAPLNPELIAIPKVSSATEVREVDAALGSVGSTSQLLVMLETAAGVLHAEAIIGASPRITAVAFGAEDYAADVGAIRSRDSQEVLYARSHVIAVAALARIDAIDQVFIALDDEVALAAETRVGLALGYRGKQLIHPKQVPIVHEAMRPSSAAVAWANEVMAAVDRQGIGEGGVVVVQQQMVDRPLIVQAQRILALHERGDGAGDSS